MARMYSTQRVLQCAVAAYRINRGYIKYSSSEVVTDEAGNEHIVVTTANKELVRQWLNNENYVVEQQDIDAAAQLYEEVQSWVFDQLAEKLSEFEQDLFKAACSEQVPEHRVGLLSFLPEAAVKRTAARQVEAAKSSSKHINAAIGEQVRGKIRVLDCRWSDTVGKFRVTAVAGSQEHVVDFWYKNKLDPGFETTITGRVKDHAANNVTRLNYVKVL